MYAREPARPPSEAAPRAAPCDLSPGPPSLAQAAHYVSPGRRWSPCPDPTPEPIPEDSPVLGVKYPWAGLGGSVVRHKMLLRALATAVLAAHAFAADPPVVSNQPYAVDFAPQSARFVRIVLRGSNSGSQACIDEIEVYGPDAERNYALDTGGAVASASSCLSGYAAHAIPHLNDGKYGNARSWIPATSGEEWAQIELHEPTAVARVVISRDREGRYGDRVPTTFEVRLSLDGKEWTTARRIEAAGVSGSISVPAVPPLPAAPPPPRTGAPSLAARTADELGFANLALLPTARAGASSVYADGALPIHQIVHLNDGLRGNEHSWISKGEPSWAEIDLGDAYWVYRVALGNDSSGTYGDRGLLSFAILAATEYNADSGAPTWAACYQQEAGPVLLERRDFRFRPVRARYVRVRIDSAGASEGRLDEVEVFGRKEPIAANEIGPLTAPEAGDGALHGDDLLKYAFIGEEHAWLKTYGRADLDPSLVPYNGRVTEYPRHVGDDRLPLALLASEPALDGKLDDACWQEASRGVVRVAYPYDFDAGPLVEHVMRAGRTGDALLLALRMDRILSAHLAVISTSDWSAYGIVAWAPGGLVYNTFKGNAELDQSTPIDGAIDLDTGCCEMRLPLTLLPGAAEKGVRVGLGMGGRHTPFTGRGIAFTFAPLTIAEEPRTGEGSFRVRVSSAEATVVSGLGEEFALAAGESQTMAVNAERGAIGDQADLSISDGSGAQYELHLFRYDPVRRTLDLAAGLANRLDSKGVDVRAERVALDDTAKRHDALAAADEPERAAWRELLFEARSLKRDLFFREPELAPLARILFVKRFAFHPSHIYTDYTDAPFRPGGAVCVLEMPAIDGRVATDKAHVSAQTSPPGPSSLRRAQGSGPSPSPLAERGWSHAERGTGGEVGAGLLAPDLAQVSRLFESESGIARDPAATFDASRIFFGYRPAADGFYHLMSMNADGSDQRQLTEGPFHDFYPCPLPDGALAFISTRCTSRVLCFRGGSSVLFRMGPDGSDPRPLSFASVSEWAPSVMSDGRIIWTRWEYIDKGADFSQTLWSINPDGTKPELVFGNAIIQPNGYASGREVPGTSEIACTLVSHFGDINGPIALVDVSEGRFNPAAIRSITPEVPWPGMWPATECFRDPVPISRDYFLCSHAPRDRFGLYAIDRYGDREVLHLDPAIDSMGPTPFRKTAPPPVVADTVVASAPNTGTFLMLDVNAGLGPDVPRGTVKYIRVVEEVRHDIRVTPNRDHEDFMKWYASPVDIVSGPFGWPTYVAKAALGIVPVEEDGSAEFTAPAGKVLYLEALDEHFDEVQRMRSVVQLQPGETRTCVGCHEDRATAPPTLASLAAERGPVTPAPPSWGAEPFSYERVVQPVLDRSCIACHLHMQGADVDLTGTLDEERVPASYRTLVQGGYMHYVDCGWNSGGCEKLAPLSFGTVKSKLWEILADHHDVKLTPDDELRIKTWTDLNCPLWPDYVLRSERPGPSPGTRALGAGS